MPICKPSIFTRFILLMVSLWIIPAFAQNGEPTMLTAQQKAIIPIAAFTAIGDIDNLKKSLNEGLDSGLTINETKETLVHVYAYAGFPRALNGLTAFSQLLDERKKQGKIDQEGKEASPIPQDRSMLEIGSDIQTKLVGQPVRGGIYDFAPAIDQFLKSHLFGDIFIRDVLDYQTREVATIAVLASLSGLEPQLQGHYNIAMNTGLNATQLQEIVDILNDKLGTDVGTRAQTTLNHVLSPK